MNLMLCAEARHILTPRRGRATTRYWIGDQLPSLPDSIFEESQEVCARPERNLSERRLPVGYVPVDHIMDDDPDSPPAGSPEMAAWLFAAAEGH